MKKKGSRQSTSPKRDYGVFLSHATYDKWIAKVVREKIQAFVPGVKVWLDDRDIDGGNRIPDSILKAIEDCQEVVVLLTPSSKDREWVTIEVGAAWGQHKRIVPLFYHVDPDSIVDVIKDRRGYHLHELDDFLANLKSRAEGHMIND